MSPNEVWLRVSAEGVHVMEHEGDYSDTDVLVHIASSAMGDPVIRVLRPT